MERDISLISDVNLSKARKRNSWLLVTKVQPLSWHDIIMAQQVLTISSLQKIGTTIMLMKLHSNRPLYDCFKVPVHKCTSGTSWPGPGIGIRREKESDIGWGFGAASSVLRRTPPGEPMETYLGTGSHFYFTHTHASSIKMEKLLQNWSDVVLCHITILWHF